MISVTREGFLLEVGDVVARKGHWSGDGLFETLRADAKRGAWFFERHRDRMAEAAERRGLELPERRLFRRATDHVLSELGPWDAVVRWYLIATDAEGRTELLVEADRYESPPSSWYDSGLSLGHSTIPHPGLGSLGKSISWGWARAAARHALRRGDHDDVLCRDNKVVETARAAIVCRADGIWYTPDPKLGGLPSVTRAVLSNVGWGFRSCRFSLTEFAAADAVICLSSLRLAVAVRSLCGHEIPEGSGDAAAMRQALRRAAG